MRLLVFQHIPIEHPGILRDFLGEDGIDWDAVELDDGEAIPDLDDYDALWVMGGPMNVWDAAAHPWLVAEKAVIREAVQRDLPMLGVCLGHQLLADALGGKVELMAAPEVGIDSVEINPVGREDPLFVGLDRVVRCLQWHSSEVTQLPADAVTLASSPACPVQAFRVGEHAYGVQYHVELTAETVPEWGCVPAYADSLETVLGAGAGAHLEAEAGSLITNFNRDARLLYENFMRIAGR